MNDRWPKPSYDDADQPHFLFLLTPPYSGSTALCHILDTSEKTVLLHPKGEGQWLVPGLHDAERWNPDKPVDYASVKAVWLNRYQQLKQQNRAIDTVIEKSPPNLVRIDAIASRFRRVSFLANNRNPYASCASILYRNYSPETLDTAERARVLGSLAEDWVWRAGRIRTLTLTLDCPLITYEQFCSRPQTLLALAPLAPETLESIDTDARVQVKDYPLQKIADQNQRQIALLGDEEIRAISDVLKPHAECLDFFGYRVM